MTTFEAPRVEVVENALEPTAPPRRRRVKRKTINTVIWFVVLLALTAIVLYPLVWLFFSTFKPSSEFGQNQGLLAGQGFLNQFKLGAFFQDKVDAPQI